MRLFLALWPDATVVRQIEAVRQQLFDGRPPGRPVSSDNLHITLQFLGHTEEDNLDCIRQAAAAIRFPAFDLRLDHLGHWARPRVVWLGCHQFPEVLTTLVRDLNTGMSACGFAPEERPFHPHLTLQRKVRRLIPREIDPIDWHVDSFVLVESDTRPEGVQYRVIDRWPAAQI
jgi:2'-5' RNA ligase